MMYNLEKSASVDGTGETRRILQSRATIERDTTFTVTRRDGLNVPQLLSFTDSATNQEEL